MTSPPRPKSEGGRAPTAVDKFTLKVERFKDHAGDEAIRVYRTNQDPKQDTLQPLWSYQVYITYNAPALDFNDFAEDLFDTLTDVTIISNIWYWRLEIFPMSPKVTSQQCADHFRKEKAARETSALFIPDYSRTRSYSGLVMIIRDPTNWKPNGIDLFCFDLAEDLEVNDGDRPFEAEDMQEKIWIKDPYTVDGEDFCCPTAQVPLVAELETAWEEYPGRAKIFEEPLIEARSKGRTSWDP